jgi:hypothetical protein
MTVSQSERVWVASLAGSAQRSRLQTTSKGFLGAKAGIQAKGSQTRAKPPNLSRHSPNFSKQCFGGNGRFQGVTGTHGSILFKGACLASILNERFGINGLCHMRFLERVDAKGI